MPLSAPLPGRAERLAFAKAYPFARPPGAYVYAAGAVLELLLPLPARLEEAAVRVGGVVVRLADHCRRHALAAPAPWEARIAVIAHGSNASPARLAQKFAAAPQVIPVLQGWLDDCDVVFAPHFARYGSLPATLERSPGTRVAIAVTYLTAAQLLRMDETEVAAVGANYVRGRLEGVTLEVAGRGRLETAQVYLAKRGALGLEGGPCALAVLDARGRRFRARLQGEVLAVAARALAPHRSPDDFLDDLIRDSALRREANRALASHALPLTLPGFKPGA